MQPLPLFEEVHLYKPNRLPETSRSVQVGAVQGVNVPKVQSQAQAAMAGDLFYLRVVKELEDDNGTFKKKEEQAGENGAGKMEVDGERRDGMEGDSKSSIVVNDEKAFNIYN